MLQMFLDDAGGGFHAGFDQRVVAHLIAEAAQENQRAEDQETRDDEFLLGRAQTRVEFE
jgi:hypothetical protein